MSVFLNKNYYCDICKVSFNHLGSHSCNNICSSCKRLNCEVNQSKSFCSYCKISINNDTCGRLHKERFCKSLHFCHICNRKKLKNHVCGDNEKWCPNCKKSVSFEHKCYILTVKQAEDMYQYKKEEKFNGYIFF